MPFVHLQILGAQPASAATEALQRGLTDLMAGTLRKKRELTVVAVEHAASARVFCGARELSTGRRTAQLTAFVTAGTNTAAEKAAFQARAHALLVAELGEPATPLYIVVQEVPAGDWGYGGLSQAARADAGAAQATSHPAEA